MNQSALRRLTKPKGAPGLPLGLGQVLALNLALKMVALGYLSALVRRNPAEAAQSMVSLLVQPVVTDLIALTVLIFLTSTSRWLWQRMKAS